MNVYYQHIRRRQQALTSAGPATPFSLRLWLHFKGAHAASVRCVKSKFSGGKVSNEILDQIDIWELFEVEMRNDGTAMYIKDARK
jgi:hypothetical protein